MGVCDDRSKTTGSRNGRRGAGKVGASAHAQRKNGSAASADFCGHVVEVGTPGRVSERELYQPEPESLVRGRDHCVAERDQWTRSRPSAPPAQVKILKRMK